MTLPQATASPASQAADTASPAATQNPEDKMPRVSAEELKQLVAANKAVIIDVRTPEAYHDAHIKGAISLPVSKIEAGEYKDLPRDKRIISYCT
jgi:rhodanese-related sulfurtransferase